MWIFIFVLCAFLQDQNFRPILDWTWSNTSWLKILDWWDCWKQSGEHHYTAATSVWSTHPVMDSRPTEFGQRTGVTCIITTRCQLMLCLYMDITRLYRFIMTVCLEILTARDHLDEENRTLNKIVFYIPHNGFIKLNLHLAMFRLWVESPRVLTSFCKI